MVCVVWRVCGVLVALSWVGAGAPCGAETVRAVLPPLCASADPLTRVPGGGSGCFAPSAGAVTVSWDLFDLSVGWPDGRARADTYGRAQAEEAALARILDALRAATSQRVARPPVPEGLRAAALLRRMQRLFRYLPDPSIIVRAGQGRRAAVIARHISRHTP